jgi:hypothetical protein
LRFAYADPPYPGVAHRYPEKTEVDHVELIARLIRDYPDGWALSTSSPSLRTLLPLCPPAVRVLAWVKPWANTRPSVPVSYAWEPIVLCGGRRGRLRPRGPGLYPPADWCLSMPTTGQRVLGAKPATVCAWLFACLGAQPGDDLDDLYPGSGAVGRAWEAYLAQRPLRLEPEPVTQLALEHAS